MRAATTGVLAAMGLLVSALALAAPDAEPWLEYVPLADCPSRADLVRQLQTRARRWDTLQKSRLRVSVAPIDGGYLGRLTLVDAAGNAVERDLDGATCEEVTTALALIATVTVDQGIDENRAEPTPATNQLAPTMQPARTTVPLDVAAPHQPKTAQRVHPLSSYSLGFVVGFHNVIAPTMAPTLGLSLAHHPKAIWGDPEYRIEVLFGWSQRRAVLASNGETLGSAAFSWFASRAAACPARIAIGPARVGPCALVELGTLRGNGTSSSGEETNSGVWLAPGVLLDGSLQVDPFRLRLAVGPLRPLVRDNFAFQPGPSVFKPGAVGLVAEIEAAWTFD